MKKIYLSFLSVLTIATLNAQLTQSNHAPASGDTWETYQCDSTAINPGTAGTGKVWNFASIATRSSVVVNYATTAISGNTAYPAANVSVTASNNNSNVYNSSSTKLDYYGGKIALSGITADLKYSVPALYAFYPMTMSTPSTAATGGTIISSSPVAANGTFSGSSTVIADASGTVILPGTTGTFTNVTRVKLDQVINFSVTTPFPATGTITQMNYDFYQASIKAPIFSISVYTVNVPGFPTSTQTLVTRNKNAVGTTTSTTVGLIENEVVNISVYPNPAGNFVNISLENKMDAAISIYDITGKLVQGNTLAEMKNRVDLSSFNNGLYLYTIKDADNRTLKTGKLTVSH
jgi:hypothetical protein